VNKPQNLRDHLLGAISELRHNPDRLLVFVDQGTVRSTAAAGLSFEYSYNLQLILTDFAGSPDAVVVPLLAWLLVNQSELLTNLELAKDSIKFEVDVLDNSKVDMAISLPLTERVLVKRQDNGQLLITYPGEPQYTEQLPAQSYQLYADGILQAEWTSAPPTPLGVDLESPQIKRPAP
jgi:hypothetical protein